MKKCFCLFLVLSLAAGFATAEDKDEGIGLSVGVEFGIENINKANDEDMAPYLMPMIIYENSFLDDTLDVYAEIDYTIGLAKETNEDGHDVNPQSMYADLMFGYNLKLGETSTLSFILENEFDEITISPEYSLTGIFTPAIKFNQNLDIGDLYFKVGAPITYNDDKDADKLTGLDFTIGWDSSFGLGIEAKFCTMIVPKEYAGYTHLEATISYETDHIYFEVETIIPKEVDKDGITITPEFDINIQKLTFYVKSEFAGIGITDYKVVVSPALGIKFHF
jgi:hypothetical protein